MFDSHPARFIEANGDLPLELGSPFLKTDEKTGLMIPKVTKKIAHLLNEEKPHFDLPDDVLQGLAKLDQEEGERCLTSLVDGIVSADETLSKIRSVARSLIDVATDRMADLYEEVNSFRKDRRGLPSLRLLASPPAEGEKQNLDYVQLFFFCVLIAALWFCFKTEWDNAVIVALNSSLDFGEQLEEQKRNATLFVFCVVAMPAIIFKVVDLLLPWQWRTIFRLSLGGLGGLGVLALIYEWGMIAGGGHSTGGPMDGAAVADSHGLFFMLQTGVFAVGTFLLTLPAFWVWGHVRASEYVYDTSRVACNQFAGEKETEWAGWNGLLKSSEELLDSISGVRNKLLGTSRTWIANERKRFQLQQQAANALQQFNEFDRMDNPEPMKREVLNSQNGSQSTL